MVMSEKCAAPVRTARITAITVIAALLTFMAAGCTHTATSGAASGFATSSAVAKAKGQVNSCIAKTGATKLLTTSGRTEFVNCMKSMVPPAKQEAFKSCITSAAESDKLWTSAGRAKFTNVSLPSCVDAAA
jgi:hypothetical protein